MLNFDERDLVRHAEEARFFPIELKLEAEIRPIEPRQSSDGGRSDGLGADS